MRHPPRHIFEHDPDALRAWCAEHGMAAYRADQILDWVYAKRTADPEAMSNLSKSDRAALARGMTFLSGSIVRHQLATDGTQKLLIEWEDARATPSLRASSPEGSDPSTPDPLSHPLPLAPQHAAPSIQHDAPQTECVLIPTESRNTACISSQVGCPVGCAFCASGLGGLESNLSAGRIVEQVWRLNQLLAVDAPPAPGATARGGLGAQPCDGPDPTAPPQSRRAVVPAPRVTNIVFMGMGEPLANLGSVIRAIRTITAPWAFNISARKVTVSTVGLPRAIDKLAEQLDLPVTLALSLHAPNDELRRRLIPWAEYTTIKDLLAACQRWFDKTGREITLEYTLLRAVNDRPEHAAELAQVARSLRANVNLIRYNEVPGLPFQRPQSDDVREFQRLLRARGVNTHIRRSRGRDIAAACGQLRHEAAAGRT